MNYCDKVFYAHKEVVNSVSYTPDGTYIISGSQDREIGIWNPWTKKKVAIIDNAHSKSINRVVSSNENTFLLSCSDDQKAFVWDISTLKVIKRLLHDKEVTLCDYVTKDCILTATKSNRIYIWDARQSCRSPTDIVDVFEDTPLCMVRLPNDNILFGCADGCLITINLKLQSRTKDKVSLSPIVSMCISPTGDYIFIYCLDSTVKVILSSTGERLHTLTGLVAQQFRGGIALSSSGETVCASSEDGKMLFWDLKRSVEEIAQPSGSISGVDGVMGVTCMDSLFSKAHLQFVTGGADGTVRIWKSVDMVAEKCKGTTIKFQVNPDEADEAD
eukprot:GDKJ01005346.1.p1 GENE.GDKJ01005346.1~~GDKJ01005346.1.p1  ORF type:complete len:339 (-),score=38.44 GDKJ01005346.1:22-1011(-)